MEVKQSGSTILTRWSPGGSYIKETAVGGFTGHACPPKLKRRWEHLLWFNLINMNGRVYDPLVGQFLNPDNHVQAPYFTQSLNRYGYCLNNPLKYTDPSGERLKWWHWVLGDIFTGGFFSATSAGIMATVPSAQITVNAIDFTAAFYNSIAHPAKNSFSNALEIEFGGFTGSFKQILSRWTWELPQTMLGNTYSHYINLTGKVDNVSFFGGATVLKCYGDEIPMGKGALGVTLGSYVIGNNQIAADPNNWLFQH